MNNQNQNSQNPTEQTTAPETRRDERGTINKATAWGAGILAAVALGGGGMVHAKAGNNSPDSDQGRVNTPATAPQTPGGEVVVNDNNMAPTPEPGPVDDIAPKQKETTEPAPAAAQTDTAEPAKQEESKPAHPKATRPPEGPVVVLTPESPSSTEGPVVIDDSGMTPTPSPTPSQSPEGPVIIDDSSMTPHP